MKRQVLFRGDVASPRPSSAERFSSPRCFMICARRVAGASSPGCKFFPEFGDRRPAGGRRQSNRAQIRRRASNGFPCGVLFVHALFPLNWKAKHSDCLAVTHGLAAARGLSVSSFGALLNCQGAITCW